MASIDVNFSYKHIPTIYKFHQCRKRVKAILGPVGSAKSSGCIFELFQAAQDQEPTTDGLRKSRWLVIRNVYRQLHDTTIKSFFDWFPPRYFGDYNKTEDTFTMQFPMSDGTKLYSEFLFRAMDKPEHVANLLSLEVSGAWINEYREIAKIIFDGIDMRIGRYPAHREVPCTYPFIIMDSNPPDFDHFTYKMFEEDLPADPAIAAKMELFRQPGGRSKNAENLPNLPPGYYENMVIGKDKDWIKVYVDAEYGYVKSGRPVYSNWSDASHMAPEPLKPIVGIPLVVGFDFALNPAAVFTQYVPDGRFLVYREAYGPGMTLRQFISEIFRPIVQSCYSSFRIVCIGDPTGINRASTDGSQCFQELKNSGFVARPAKTNAIQARIAAVDSWLTRMYKGKAAFQLDASCNMLRKGFLGEYKYPEIHGTYGVHSGNEPSKGDFSHVHDALQMAALGYEMSVQAATTRTEYHNAMQSSGQPTQGSIDPMKAYT